MRVWSRSFYLCLLIAFVFLSFALSITRLHAQGSADERVFFNAKVFTAEPENLYAEAVAIRGDKVVAVGTYSDVARSVSATAERVNLQGKSLFRVSLILTATASMAARS